MRFSKPKIIARGVAIISAITIIVGGVTFAALQSQQAQLKGNTIQTAMANLQLSGDGVAYSNSLSGYAFTNLVPGGATTPAIGYPVYIKNTGTTPVALKFSIAKAITNTDNVDLSKVHVVLSPQGSGSPQNFTLQELISSAASGGLAVSSGNRLIPSQTTVYTLQVSMDVDAFSGASTTLSDIDFSFGAVAVN